MQWYATPPQKKINDMLTNANTPWNLEKIARLADMDHINLATLLHRLGRFTTSTTADWADAVQHTVNSPLFEEVIRTTIDNARGFNSKSAATALWGITKLYTAGHFHADPRLTGMFLEVLAALEGALQNTLPTTAQQEGMTQKGVSMVWYCVGAIVENGGHPLSRFTMNKLWERTHELCITTIRCMLYNNDDTDRFDAFGISNVILAIGQLCRHARQMRHPCDVHVPHPFDVPDVTLSLLATIARMLVPTMTVQGLVSCATGCSQMHLANASVMSFTESLVTEAAVVRPEVFSSVKSMHDMVTAVCDLPHLMAFPDTRKMLVNFRASVPMTDRGKRLLQAIDHAELLVETAERTRMLALQVSHDNATALLGCLKRYLQHM